MPPGYVAPLSQLTQPSYVPQSVALSGPPELTDVDHYQAPPPGYTEVRRTRTGMALGGGIMLSVAYFHCALVAAAMSENSYDQNQGEALWVPVLGPFIQMAQTESATGNVLLVGVGAVQLIGAIMLYRGTAYPERVFVRNDLIGDVKVAPVVDANGAGVMMLGAF